MSDNSPELELRAENEAPKSWRNLLPARFSGNRGELMLATGAVLPFVVIGVASVAPFAVGRTAFVLFAVYMGMICLWAARSKQGFSPLFRGVLFSFGLIWILLVATVIYLMVYGFTLETSRDFGSQHSIYTVPVERETRDPKTIA